METKRRVPVKESWIVRLYRTLCKFVKWLSLTISLFLIPVFLVYAIVMLFLGRLCSVLVLCMALWLITSVNAKI